MKKVLIAVSLLALASVPATAVSPEYVQLAKNVEVIPNIEDAVKSQSALLTHEGLFGPLLFAEQTRAFFIELKPGMFLEEHPHDIGSIVYTVRGKWVLASEHKRQVMEAGGRRVAVVRAVFEAPDVYQAAKSLREVLDSYEK